MASSSNHTKNDDDALRAQMMADIGLQRRIAITQAHDEDDRVILNVEQEEAALQRQRITLAPGDPRAAHLTAWNNFKENDPHIDIEARKLPTITAGGVTHRLNRGGNLATPETNVSVHGVGLPGMSQKPAKFFVYRSPQHTSSESSNGTTEIPLNNGGDKSKKHHQNKKSNGNPVASTQSVPALDPRSDARPSRSMTLLSSALANLSINRSGPTVAQPVTKPNLVSPDAFMAAVKSTFGAPNPTAAAASTIDPVASPSPPVKDPSPSSSPDLKPARKLALKPDRGRRAFEERLLGLQASKYAPKNMAIDIDVVMKEAGDDIPDIPKTKEASHARPLGLMASKWAPKQ